MADFIPTTDAEFEIWRVAFDDFLKNNLAALGVTAAQSTALTALQAGWSSALNGVAKAKSALEAAVALKNEARQQLVDALRELVRQIQANPATTDEQRAGLNITIPDTKHTRVPIPTTRPIGWVETQPLQTIVNFRDKETPNSKAKPPGARGCQIWFNIGTTPPTDLDQYDYLATDSQTPYTHDHDMEDVGKTVSYRLRWANTRDEPGPWSDVITATVTG
jgi:hypothetical protein